MPEEHIDAERRQSGNRIRAADPCTQLAHARHGGAEVHLHVARRTGSVMCGVAHLRIQARCAYQCLGRNAADIQTIAANQIALDQGHACTECGGALGRDQASGTSADHEQLVAFGRLRIAPVGRAHIGQTLTLEGIDGRAHGSLRTTASSSQPPLKPAARRPVTTCGHCRIRRQTRPLRWFSIISKTMP